MHLIETKAKDGLRFWQTSLLIAASILAGIGMWGYFDGVAVDAQEAAAAAQNIPRGNLSDLYPRWLGTREFLLHGRDPYSAEVTAEIQKGVYGVAIDSRKPGNPTDEQRFAYPLYVVFLLAPTTNLPFPSVQRIYLIVAAVLSVASVWFWLCFFGESRPGTPFILGSLLSLGSFPVVQALHLNQLSLIVWGLIAGAVAAVSAGVLWAAGILLALAMIKPQAAFVTAGWLLLWAASDWRKRRALLVSFTAMMGALLAGAEFLMPGWLWKWRDAVLAYMRYIPGQQPQVQFIFGKYVGAVLACALVAGLGVLCWRTRRDSVSADRFLLILPLIMATDLALTPLWKGYDQIFLMPALLLGFRWRDEYSRLKPFGRAVVVFTVFVLAWPWVSATILYMMYRMSNVAQSLVVAPVYLFPFAPVATLASLILIARERLSRAAS